MIFKTEIQIPLFNFKISHQDKIMMMGSCFAENIAGKMQSAGFRTCVNPFGILYNPASISKSIQTILNSQKYDISDLIQLTAQALCLEEMNNVSVLNGIIWSYSTRKRTNIEINTELRDKTIEIIENTSKIFADNKAPVASYKRICSGCSLFDLCQPLLIGNDKSAMYIKRLFKGDFFEEAAE